MADVRQPSLIERANAYIDVLGVEGVVSGVSQLLKDMVAVLPAPSDTDRQLPDVIYEAWNSERGDDIPWIPEAGRLKLANAIQAAGFSRTSHPSTENLEIVNGWLVERGVNPLDYPAGAAYGAQPYSDAAPLVKLSELSGWPVQVEVTDEKVTTIEELNALPNDSVILDSMADVGVVHGESVWYPGTQPIQRSKVAKHYLPARVVYRPAALGGGK